MKQIIYNKTIRWALLLIMVFGLASCSQEDIPNTVEETDQHLSLNMKVEDFHSFSSPETRALGIPDTGKSEWEVGDEVFVLIKLHGESLQSPLLHIECLTYTYDGTSWNCTFGNDQIPLTRDKKGNDIQYKAALINGYYNPSLEWVEDSGISKYNLNNKSGKTHAVSEAFRSKDININEGGVLTKINFTIDFSEQMSSRKYSRIRIVAPPKAKVSIRATGLIPSWNIALGTSITVNQYANAYTSADSNGNAFYFFKWKNPTTFTIETQSETGLKLNSKNFRAPIPSIDGKSYEIDMR